jgi:hypothetical protein
MPDLIAISQGLNAVKAATEIVKTMVGLRESANILENSVELNRKIADVQIALNTALSEQATLVQTISDLKEEIAHMKTWETEKQRYELKRFYPGTFAYSPKEGYRGAEPIHYLCTNCYEDGKRSFLQATGRGDYGYQLLFCHTCKMELPLGNEIITEDPHQAS